MIPARQDEHETLETFFKNVDLSFAYKILTRCFHISGPRRPPRNPLGLFRTFLIMRMKAIRSLREMTRILNTDQRIRKLCLIKDNQKGYTRSVLSRFSKRVLDKAKTILQRCKANVRSVVADSQYSDSKLRGAVEKATIPYPANHMKGVEGLL